MFNNQTIIDATIVNNKKCTNNVKNI